MKYLSLFLLTIFFFPAAQTKSRIVDLTHPFDETTVYWPTAPRCTLRKEETVSIRSRWSKKYLGTGERGTAAVARLHYR